MLDVFNFPTPQQSNYQEFYGGGTSQDWTKPRGVSMVRFMLIGAGGGGGNGNTSSGSGGGGSGAVTSWIGPAIFIPDVLRITIASGGTSSVNAGVTSVIYQAKDGTGYTLLTANGGNSGNTININPGNGGGVMNANYFTASGIFTSTAGQNGTGGSASGAGANISASSTTFLQGGAGGAGAAANTGGSVTPNYGYTVLPATTAGGTVAGANGYFITQPILLGVGGAGGTTSTAVGTGGGRGGIGCGGGGSGEDGNSGGRGGDGAVFIWSW
jgi:hypothetical protein